MSHKLAIYDPYLDTLGGGERYCLSLAKVLTDSGYQVDLFWSGRPDILTLAQNRFGLNLEKINLLPDIFHLRPTSLDITEGHISPSHLSSQATPISPILKLNRLFQKFITTRGYSYTFFLGDGSIPLLFGHTNYLHIQVPFNTSLSFPSLTINRLKLLTIKKIICNSIFTKNFTSRLYGSSKCHVLYPPVNTSSFNPRLPKLKQILTVGRFDNILNSKKQDVLIQAFIKMYQKNPISDWQLILAGGSLESPQNNNFLKHLTHLSQNFPIKLIVNPDYELLKTTYEQSSIYWHAAGYGIDQQAHPESTEHFGMSVVEAMAAGCIPLVANRGGLPEIVTHRQNGFLWDQPDELIAPTMMLIGSPKLFSELQSNAVSSSSKFSLENFSKNIKSVFNL